MDRINEITSSQEKIKMVCLHGNHFSYYNDANGILKGEWGGCEKLDEVGPNGETMYEIYYSKFCQRIPINEYGYFYNKFSCRKYDAVLMVRFSNLFICEKNNRYGLIDEKENIILHLVYNSISPYSIFHKKQQVFIVATEIGDFLFNYSDCKQSNVYDEIINLKTFYNEQVIFKHDGEYGLLNMDGSVLLNPMYNFDFNYGNYPRLTYSFHSSEYHISIKDRLLYGKIPINKYDLYFQVLDDNYLSTFYIIKDRKKYGLLNWDCESVSKPLFDDIILYKRKEIWEQYKTTFVICKVGHLYTLYNLPDRNCIISGCEKMNYMEFHDYRIHIEFEKHGTNGYVTYEGVIITNEKFDTIHVSTIGSYIVSKDHKYGALNAKGKYVVPCIYDSIEDHFSFGEYILCYEPLETIKKFVYSYIVSQEGKFGAFNGNGEEISPCIYSSIQLNEYGELIAIKDGEEINLTPKLDSLVGNSYDYDCGHPAYGKYAGSYAQDEAGWSDDDIDTVLDGDPDAYWNID